MCQLHPDTGSGGGPSKIGGSAIPVEVLRGSRGSDDEGRSGDKEETVIVAHGCSGVGNGFEGQGVEERGGSRGAGGSRGGGVEGGGVEGRGVRGGGGFEGGIWVFMMIGKSSILKERLQNAAFFREARTPSIFRRGFLLRERGEALGIFEGFSECFACCGQAGAHATARSGRVRSLPRTW